MNQLFNIIYYLDNFCSKRIVCIRSPFHYTIRKPFNDIYSMFIILHSLQECLGSLHGYLIKMGAYVHEKYIHSLHVVFYCSVDSDRGPTHTYIFRWLAMWKTKWLQSSGEHTNTTWYHLIEAWIICDDFLFGRISSNIFRIFW